MRIAVLGAGAWGTALAIVLDARHDCVLWTRSANHAASLLRDRTNVRYLPALDLPPTLAVTADSAAALAGADLAIAATPTSGLRQTLSGLKRIRPDLPLLWACKGFETGTMKLPHQVAAEALDPGTPCGALSGPSFAAEVAAGLPTALTLASESGGFARSAATALHQPRLRIYSSTDVVGVELGGALKNVMAIAAGISDGLGFGHNARAALIVRGLAEINRLGTRLGGRSETFMGLTGAGDLILTCTGDLSRNRQVGLRIAQGNSLERVLRDLGHVAEGVTTALEVDALAARLGVDMPITRAVCRVLFESTPPRQAVEELLARDPKAEN